MKKTDQRRKMELKYYINASKLDKKSLNSRKQIEQISKRDERREKRKERREKRGEKRGNKRVSLSSRAKRASEAPRERREKRTERREKGR